MPLHVVVQAHAACPLLPAACNSRRWAHSFGSLPTAQPCLQTALEAAEAAARAVAEAEEAAALATRLMDAANRYEQQAQDFGHHHHPEGHVSPCHTSSECCVADGAAVAWRQLRASRSPAYLPALWLLIATTLG